MNVRNNKILSSKHSNTPGKSEKTSGEVTAKAYVVYDHELNPVKRTILSNLEYNNVSKRQIASLTKMMTLLLSLKIAKRFSLDTKNTYFRVSNGAGNVPGTSAELEPLQWITVEDLFYGLMLPSGNDAATVLA